MPMPTSVLVIDDDADTRATLRFALEDAGYAVIEAADGVCALDVLQASPCGLVVVFDYRMPHMDGDALLALAEREGWLARRHTFICLTASPQAVPASMRSLLVRYGVALVGKPFDLDDLLMTVKQAEQRLTRRSNGARRSRWPRFRILEARKAGGHAQARQVETEGS